MDEKKERYYTGITMVLSLIAGVLVASLIPEVPFGAKILYSVMIGSVLFAVVISYQRNMVR